MKAKEEEEHESAAHGHRVHAYFEVDVTEPAYADREEAAQEEMDSAWGNIGQSLENEPGPKIKDHGRDIGDEPFLLSPEHHGADEPEPPHQEYGKGREKGVVKDDVQEPEDFQLMIETGKGIGMDKDEKTHHIRADKERMKYIRDQVGEKTRERGEYRWSGGAGSGGTCGLRWSVHNSFLSLATGMFNCSRYLATVRRAML
jgi:hypothetical protein